MFASIKHVGADRGLFWVIWTVRSFAEGVCIDCGFAPDLEAALHAVRSAPCVKRGKLYLLGAEAAYIFYSLMWLGKVVDSPIFLTPQDRLYECERLRFANGPEHGADKPKKRRSKRDASARRPGCTSSMPTWCSVLGLQLPCTAADVRAAFRVRALKEHPDCGGTSQGFIRLKRAHDEAMRAVGER